jgi:hypothetical protein
MTTAVQKPVKLFQFPRMLGIPNLSPFCCKLETWLRITGTPYEIVETPDPRKGPKRKLPFIEDAGTRIADTSIIIDHLKRTRGVDPDARLDASQRTIALLVQRTLEEHYAFVVAYTHLVRDEGVRYTRASSIRCHRLSARWSFTRYRGRSRICSGNKASCATRTATLRSPECAIGAPCWRSCPTGHSSSAASLPVSTRSFSVRWRPQC